MDRSLRDAELDFASHPEDPWALLRWWSAKLRSGYTIDLADLSSKHAAHPEIDQFLLSCSPEVFTISTVEPGWEAPSIPRTPPHSIPFAEVCRQLLLVLYEHYVNDYGADALQLSELRLHYFGWMPNLYSTEGSESEFIAAQETSNGIVIKVRLPSFVEDYGGEVRTQVIAAHFGCYTDTYIRTDEVDGDVDYIDLDLDYTNLQLDLEAVFSHAAEHVALLKNRSCKNKVLEDAPHEGLIEPSVAAPFHSNWFPIMLHNFETVEIPKGFCFPLIDVYRSTRGWVGESWD